MHTLRPKQVQFFIRCEYNEGGASRANFHGGGRGGSDDRGCAPGVGCGDCNSSSNRS